MACVYILQSLRDNRFYIGSTINLKQRLEHHFGNSTPSTKRFGGLKLVFSQEYKTLKEARKIERKLKKLKRRDYIEKMIKEGYIKMTTSPRSSTDENSPVLRGRCGSDSCRGDKI